MSGKHCFSLNNRTHKIDWLVYFVEMLRYFECFFFRLSPIPDI